MRAALVLATALVAGIATVSSGGAAAAAAPVTVQSGTTAEPGSVVQTGDRLVVPTGPEGPVTLRFSAAPQAGTTGSLTARLTLPVTDWPVGGTTDYRAAAVMTSTCSTGGGAFAPCAWSGTSLDEDGPARLVLDLPVVQAAASLDYAVTFDLPSGMGWLGSLDAPVELKDASGAVVARGTVGLDFVESVPAADERGAFHARDRDGVLWRYESTGSFDRSLTARKRVGGGWNVYKQIVQLTPTTAAGTGDLVALDAAGVAWYYHGSGNPDAPFLPRVRATGGGGVSTWSQYTAIAANGKGGLVARDKGGVLWNFERDTEGEGAGSFLPAVRVGGGWNVYTRITGFADGLVARDADGVLWKYNGSTALASPERPFDARWRIGGGWNVYDAVTGTKELGRYSHTELIARGTDGKLWAYDSAPSGFGYAPSSFRTKVGWGYGIYDVLI
ncbi:tachylectin-related carbohydrate-binding protein [Streptomyces sp. NPDC058877]|uniref:tachylectin-related carbohydrate-binding protein n=1 Tax=unclassified Streptomyces TaxID=2593676 RepID=UPI00367F0F4A